MSAFEPLQTFTRACIVRQMSRSVLIALSATAATVSLTPTVTASPYHDRTLQRLQLRHAEPYSHARATLARQGWKPFRTKKDHGMAGDMLAVGWSEVSFCSGTGLAFCTFIWKRGSQCALISTAGEYYPERGAPKLWDAEVDSCPKILKRG